MIPRSVDPLVEGVEWSGQVLVFPYIKKAFSSHCPSLFIQWRVRRPGDTLGGRGEGPQN